MPLMMDDHVDMDMDDLFGDGNALSLPSRPPPKEVFQRIDELRANGCCQGVAWSKSGSIASISADCLGLSFHNLRCSPRDGTWALATSTASSQIVQNLDGGPLRHLAWSPNGCDLAVIDAFGRTTILSIENTLNRPTIYRTAHSDPSDDLHTVAGAFWIPCLPVRQQPPSINRRATKTDEGWRYDLAHAVSFGPCHPISQKSALITITTNGILRLLYPQVDRKWYEATLEIESIVSSDQLITHASVCADKNGTVLIAYATATKQLKVVRVMIKWGNKAADRNTNNSLQVSPTMAIKHVTVTNWMDTADGNDTAHFQSSMTSLSSLHILASPAPDGPTNSVPAPPTIFAIRHKLPSLDSQFNHDTLSVVDRWELTDTPQSIHPAFEQLSSRRNSTISQPGATPFLKKLDGFVTNKIALPLETTAFDRVLVFGYSDGSVEYRNRLSLAELYMEGSIDQFSHLSQIGFNVEDDESCLQFAISPSSCSAVKINTKGKLRWKGLTYHMGRVSAPVEYAQYSAIVAGFGMTAGSAIMKSDNFDDLLAIGHNAVEIPDFVQDWVGEICRILKISVDFSEESQNDNLVRNPSIQLCLSIINTWGFHGGNKPRAFASNLAWIGLQARLCVFVLTMASSIKIPVDATNKKITAVEDADATRLLTGSIKWSLDLMSYLIDSLMHPEPTSLFKPLRLPSPDPDTLPEINKTLKEKKNVALHLLLSSGTRGYLISLCRRITTIDWTARKAMATIAQQNSAADAQPTLAPMEQISAPLRSAYTAIATLTSTTPVPLKKFDEFLAAISSAVKDSYTTAGLSSTPAPGQAPNMTNASHEKRAALEQSMLFGGPIPNELIGAMTTIFSDLVPKLRESIDPSKLFFHDFSMLSLDPEDLDAKKADFPGGKTRNKMMDVFLRTPLGRYPHAAETGNNGASSSSSLGLVSRPERRYRRCTRCAAVMEDMVSRKTTISFLLVQVRKCACSGLWVSLSESEMFGKVA